MALLIKKDLGTRANKKGVKIRFFLVECHCGNICEINLTNLKKQKSCGCARTTHKSTKHKIYHIWNAMMQRCNNQKQLAYKDYGGRGIKVCERWNDVKNFIEDMYPTYKEGLSIDRININGNYEPSNCRWAIRNTQARNTRILMNTNSSGYRGVTFKKDRNKWDSRITINKKTITIGRFNTALEAAKAYDTYVIENNLEHTINGVI